MNAQTETRNQAIDAIKQIEQLPRVQRWRAAREFLFQMKPYLRPLDNGFIKQVARQRENLRLPSGRSSVKSQGRQIIDMPDFVYFAVIAFDPVLEKELNERDVRASNRAWAKLGNAFPEYRLTREAL